MNLDIRFNDAKNLSSLFEVMIHGSGTSFDIICPEGSILNIPISSFDAFTQIAKLTVDNYDYFKKWIKDRRYMNIKTGQVYTHKHQPTIDIVVLELKDGRVFYTWENHLQDEDRKIEEPVEHFKQYVINSEYYLNIFKTFKRMAELENKA